jgi:hypothetical protein
LTSDMLRSERDLLLSERQMLDQPPLRHVSVVWASQ